MNDNERDGDNNNLALDEQAFRQVIMNGGGGCDKCSGFGPGGNNDAVIRLQLANDDSGNQQSGFGPGGIEKRQQDEYFTDPSIEDSIRLCGNQHGRGRHMSIRFDLGGKGRQTDGGYNHN